VPGLNGHQSPAAETLGGSAGSVARRFVDVHCHVLPGVDDGPTDMAASMEMCRALVNDGISTVIATPHQLGRYEGANSPAQVRAAVAELMVEIEKLGLPLTVLPGADVRVHERLVDMIEQDRVTTIADKGKHILLELPHETLIDLTFLNRALMNRGIQGIMTHPERHHALRRKPELLARWIADGMLVQITAGSLIGLFGPNSQNNAWDLIDAGMVHIVATDAHDHEQRPPVFTEAFEVLEEDIGRAMAEQICLVNPLMVLEGEHIPTGRMQRNAATGQVGGFQSRRME